MNLKELYQEIILEHGKNPRNLRKTENFNKDAKGNNPLCGDNVHVYLKLNNQRKVEDISFEGSGPLHKAHTEQIELITHAVHRPRHVFLYFTIFIRLHF